MGPPLLLAALSTTPSDYRAACLCSASYSYLLSTISHTEFDFVLPSLLKSYLPLFSDPSQNRQVRGKVAQEWEVLKNATR